VLALSQNNVRLFTASRDSIERLEVPGMPADMEAALNYSGADRGSQVHSAMRGRLGKQAAVFHGQGGKPDTRKEDLSQFFRLVSASLEPVFREQPLPLLLAGVGYLLPIYRSVSSYEPIAHCELAGNCDYLSDHEIHQRAWPVMEPLLQETQADAAARYTRLAGSARTLDDLRQIVPAAYAGRVETLFVDTQAIHWGRYDPQTSAVELHDKPQPGDDDMLDLAAVQTILCRGTVYPIECQQVPTKTPAKAVLRY
jgi:hypothetical protein